MNPQSPPSLAASLLINPSPVGLAMALTGMAVMALRFPTKARVESWLADTVRQHRD